MFSQSFLISAGYLFSVLVISFFFLLERAVWLSESNCHKFAMKGLIAEIGLEKLFPILLKLSPKQFRTLNRPQREGRIEPDKELRTKRDI